MNGAVFSTRNLPADRDARIVAISLTLLAHLLLLWLTPRELWVAPYTPVSIPEVMWVELETIPEEPTLDQRYVEAAPDVPEQVPEQQRYFSDRDQVAAQPDAAPPDPRDLPMIEGDLAESNVLVTGDFFREPTPPAPPATGAESAQSPMAEQIPAPDLRPSPVAPDVLQAEPPADTGIAALPEPSVATEMPEEPPLVLPELVPEQTSRYDGPGADEYPTPPAWSEQAARERRPQPRVDTQLIPSPLLDNRMGVPGVGQLAFNSRLSEFGDYLARMKEVIGLRWRNLNYNTRALPGGGTRVIVRFDITREGRIEHIRIIEATTGRVGETLATDAITSSAPFNRWSPEMIVILGERTACEVHFYYY